MEEVEAPGCIQFRLVLIDTQQQTSPSAVQSQEVINIKAEGDNKYKDVTLNDVVNIVRSVISHKARTSDNQILPFIWNQLYNKFTLVSKVCGGRTTGPK